MPNSETDKAWHSLDTASVLSAIGATTAGLTTEEAVKRLAADGPNELRKAKPVGLLRTAYQHSAWQWIQLIPR